MELQSPSAPRGDTTRDALLDAATQVFARDGFHAVSLREIAEVAGVNQALIGYHFSNKQGLYLAVFEHIVVQMREHTGTLAEDIERALATSDSTADEKSRQAQYLPLLFGLTDRMVALMVSEQSAPWAQLIMREQQAPTAAFTVLYDGFMGRLLSLMTQLVLRLSGDGASLTDAHFQVTGILGQVLVFRSSRAGVMRHMGWKSIGQTELARIQQQLHCNLRALLVTGN